MRYNTEQKTILLLYRAGKDGIKQSALPAEAGVKKKDLKAFRTMLRELENRHIVYLSAGKYKLKGRNAYFEAEVKRVGKKSGFIEDRESRTEYFVRGRELLGAVPGDTVLAERVNSSAEGEDDGARVVLILSGCESVMTGTIVETGGRLKLRPDGFSCEPLNIIRYNGLDIKAGDKVSYTLHERAAHHSDMTVDIQSVYGSAEYARVSVDAYLDEKGIKNVFPDEVTAEARRLRNAGISAAEISGRKDLRELPIFTIDGADTKDIDDAVSIERTEGGYRLGVHIADVSHYVKKGSALDREAYHRGTSIYIADKVIPMLPPELSNGICSLNPMEDRLAFSCLMELDASGTVRSFSFEKTVIRSRVKGVYSEVNALTDDTADAEIREKYKEVSGQIPVMCELAHILIKKREQRGAPDIDSKEPEIICDADGVCVDIRERTRGFSEQIIEEFMLCANGCAARLAMDKGFPFVYRVHERPETEKLARLSETLAGLGIDTEGINDGSTAADLAALLERTKDDPKASIINNIVLRTMMKARYSDEPLGHYGLVLSEYSHFTSPIRRLADLSIHRILSEYISTGSAEKTAKKYTKFAGENASRASTTELTAVACERDGDKFYMAEYMKRHIGEEFEGYISGVTGNGFFVELANTVEGRVDVISLPQGDYVLKNDIALCDVLSGRAYTIGDRIRVKCAAADVSGGLIDFVPADTDSADEDN